MLPLFRGCLYLDTDGCPLYESSHVLEKCWPAQHQTGPRQAALLNKCLTASYASYYVFLGARLDPQESCEFRLRLAIPDDELFAEDLLKVFPDELPQPLPRALLTLDRGRYHPVDSRPWALRLAVHQLLRVLVTEKDWPPASPVVAELSYRWSLGMNG